MNMVYEKPSIKKSTSSAATDDVKITQKKVESIWCENKILFCLCCERRKMGKV